MEKVIVLTGNFVESTDNTYNKELISFPYECDHFQKHAFKCINEGSNVLITAHTGSGKTAVAIYAIANCIKQCKKVVYTSPIKSLSNEKYKDFKDYFSNLDISVGLMTGDNKINPDADLVIMTAEILRNWLFQTKYTSQEIMNFVENIGCIIMDEVHFINDPERGKVWEETIVMAPQEIQLVMLSATIDKPEEFANWIGSIRDKKIYLIPTSHRVVPLNHYLYINNQMHKIMDTSDNYLFDGYKLAKEVYAKKIKDKEKINLNLISEMVKYLKTNDLLQTIFFSFSRKNCETYSTLVSEELISDYEAVEIKHIWSKYLAKDEAKYDPLDQYRQLKTLAFRGIAYHHSGLIPILKEIIEILFQKGLIKVLFATETFAVGVNMPTRSVVFTELEKFTNHGKRFLNTAEYKQMSGRAGRRGIDTTGYSILLPLYSFPDESDIKTVLTGKVPKIESKFNIDYSFVLRSLLNNSLEINSVINKSLRENEKISIKMSIQKDLDIILKDINKYSSIETKLSIQDKDTIKVKNLIDIEKKIKQFSHLGMMFSLNKKDNKEYLNLQNELKKNSNMNALYQEVNNYFALLDKKTNIEDNLCALGDENSINLRNIIKILEEAEFIKSVDDNINVQSKGIIASQINECNPLVFTEIILSGILDTMDEIDIASLFSIFLEDKKDEEFKSDLQYTSHLVEKISQVEKIIEKFITLENKYHQHSQDNFWKITISNLDATHMWVSGAHINQIKSEGLIDYEGNFIKNMTKLYNIINDVMNTCNTIGKIELIPTLEKIPHLIIRDIISLTSLYLLN